MKHLQEITCVLSNGANVNALECHCRASRGGSLRQHGLLVITVIEEKYFESL